MHFDRKRKKEMRTVWRNLALLGAAGLAAAAMAAPSFADPAKAPDLVVNKADDGWMMVSSLLVLMMTVPGLALFYGGMVRTKNMLSMLTQVFVIQCIVCVAWFVYAYSLAFTEGSGFTSPFFGGLSQLFLKGIDPKSPAATFSVGVGLDELVYVCFQMTFAAITTALAIGGFAERMKFSAIVLFAVLWLTIVYVPIAHSVWYNPGPNALQNALAVGQTAYDKVAATAGYGNQMGALDFAGGTVVHINAGIAGMVGALLLGRRIGFGKEPMPPHSLTLTMVGASLLWVGWFGFNAGSNLEANSGAVLAMANTFVATAAAGLSWLLAEWLFKGKPSLLGLASGVVAGLVAVTPASGYAGPMGALVLGLVAGAICFFFCTAVKSAFGYDDTLDVFGVHAIGGFVGAIGTGIAVNPNYGGTLPSDFSKACDVVNGVITNSCRSIDYNMWPQVVIQAKNAFITIAWSAIGSLLVYLIISLIVGLRVSPETEREGLDISEHGERAYNM
jgi:Amt family ammonium transporter